MLLGCVTCIFWIRKPNNMYTVYSWNKKKTKIKLNNTANLFMTKCGVNSQTNIFKNILSDNLLQSCTYMFTEMIAEVIKVTKNKP